MLRVLMVLGLVSMTVTTEAIPCDEAHRKCAFRTGCGNALQGYVMGCSAILHEGPPDECPQVCQHALIALMSSDEGKHLMTCECSDDVCNETKQRVEVCRPHVMKAVRNETIVTCEVAQWICAADALCSTALEYYHRYCRSMFLGRKCSHRCKNSINILRKQEKAAKLDSCRCEGKKDKYNCSQIRTNMARLCFNKEPDITQIIIADVEDSDFKGRHFNRDKDKETVNLNNDIINNKADENDINNNDIGIVQVENSQSCNNYKNSLLVILLLTMLPFITC